MVHDDSVSLVASKPRQYPQDRALHCIASLNEARGMPAHDIFTSSFHQQDCLRDMRNIIPWLIQGGLCAALAPEIPVSV